MLLWVSFQLVLCVKTALLLMWQIAFDVIAYIRAAAEELGPEVPEAVAQLGRLAG